MLRKVGGVGKDMLDEGWCREWLMLVWVVLTERLCWKKWVVSRKRDCFERVGGYQGRQTMSGERDGV